MIVYSQKEGFYEEEGDLDWGDRKDLENYGDWHRAVGLHEGELGNDFWGSECGDRLTVRNFEKPGPYAGIVEISTPFTHQTIFAKTYADLIALQVVLAPLLLREVLTDLSEFKIVLEKAFFAWHGHAMMNVCRKCDPQEWEALQKSMQRLREKQNREKQAPG
jgi:hypothetical protein